MKKATRNKLLAAILAVFFVLGVFLVIRPVWKDDSSAESSSAGAEVPGTGQQGSQEPGLGQEGSQEPGPGRQGSANRQVKSWRVGGATVDNEYPLENFEDGFTNESCAVLQNLSSALTITVVSVRVGPSGVFTAQPCEPQLALQGGLTTSTPCAAGVVLLQRSALQGCSIGVKLLITGTDKTYKGTVTLVTRARCTTRNITPCTLLPSHLKPTKAAPITLTVDQKISFTGSDAEVTEETATPSPGPETTVPPAEIDSEAPIG